MSFREFAMNHDLAVAYPNPSYITEGTGVREKVGELK